MNTKKVILSIFMLLLIIIFLPINEFKCLAETETFDLKLQNYISSIYSNGITKQGREEIEIDTLGLKNNSATTAIYTQKKDPIGVKNGDFIIYTFKVYNEGNTNAYVQKITTNIPKGLQFIYVAEDGETLIACDYEGNSETLQVDANAKELISKNNTYWALDSDGINLLKRTFNGENTISITCDVESYLGKKEELKAYNQSEDSELSSISLSVVLRVIAEDRSGMIIRNEASITEATNKDLQDRDSNQDIWQGKDEEKNYQDDEDYETIILGKIDLGLNKFVLAVSDDITIQNEEYLESKKEETLIIPLQTYILYNIRVYNKGQESVYVSQITDYLPEYLDYVYCDFNDKYGWNLTENGKTITTNYLSYKEGQDTNLLKLNNKQINNEEWEDLDYKDVQVLCRVNEKTPLNTLITNKAEITGYQDENGKDIVSDTDSIEQTIDEKKGDYEPVLVKEVDSEFEDSILKSEEKNITNQTKKSYKIIIFIVIGFAIIILFIIEFILIKKYILI